MSSDQLYNRIHLMRFRNSKQTKLEVHADGVKEVEVEEREECPFCAPTWCDEPHCPYTKEEE